MMNVVFLILPVFAAANIQIDITATKNERDQTVNLLGEQTDLISDTEITSFGLDDANLKNAVEAYYGKIPDDAFVRSPNVWEDLYYSYNWKQVTRTLKPISAKIFQVNSERVLVLSRKYENNNTEPISWSVVIMEDVQNTLSLSWNTDRSLTLGSDIKYDVNFGDAKGESMSFSNSWGLNAEKRKTMVVGPASGMDIMIKPGDIMNVELYATRTTVQVEITYEAYLSGDVVVNYSDPFKGHHLWPLDVRGVMHAGNINNSIRSTEVIEVAFYSDPKIFIS